MATNDLCNELTKGLAMDEPLEQRICTAILKQLDDRSNDVQSVAVKCLGKLLLLLLLLVLLLLLPLLLPLLLLLLLQRRAVCGSEVPR
jgi:hypothetical protein